MKRLAKILMGLAFLASPAIVVAQDEAEVKEALRQQSLSGIRTESALGAVAFQTITGTPLTIYVASDASFQVLNANVPGSGQFYPSGGTCTPGDAGVFADVGGILYAPDFDSHPCGTATDSLGTYTPWTPVSISAVAGTGTSVDPFNVNVIVDAGTTGLRLMMTVTYVNGDGFFRVSNRLGTAQPMTVDLFFGADIYLANDDDGVPFRDATTGGVGGNDCIAQTYTIQFIPNTASDAYAANGFSSVWSQIGADALGNTVSTGCIDNGAALEWSDRAVDPAAQTVIDLTVQFSGFVGATPTPTIPAFTAVVPTLSFPMMALFAVALAALGFVLMRRH